MDRIYNFAEVAELVKRAAKGLQTQGLRKGDRVGLMLNVRRAELDQVLELLPALRRPTVAALSDDDWVSITTILEERAVRELIPKLKAAGGHGIVEYPLNKIVL